MYEGSILLDLIIYYIKDAKDLHANVTIKKVSKSTVV